MTFRRDRAFWPLAMLLAALAFYGCGPATDDVSPVEAAREHLAAGRPGDAQIILKRLIADGTDAAEVAAYLGEAGLARGDIDDARRWLVPERFAAGTEAHGFRMLGRLAMAEGRLPDAGRSFDRALSFDSRNAELWVDIGRLRYRGGEQIQALEAADQAVSLDPSNAAALQFRGQLARDADGMEAGVLWFEGALARQPDNLELRTELAAALGDAGRAVEALAVLRAGDGRAAATQRGLFIQSVIAARAGNLSLARDLLERSGMLRQELPAALLLSAIIDLEEKNYGIAAQTLERLARRQSDNPRVIDLLAQALSRSGSDREVVHRFAARTAGPNGSAYLRTIVGRSYEALGDRYSAARFLDLAIAGRGKLSVLPSRGAEGFDSGSVAEGAVASRDRIRAAIGRRQDDRALAKARELVRRYPGSGDMLALLGDAELAAGNRRAALRAYSLSATVRRPWSLAPRLVTAMDNPSQAIGFLEEYLKRNPANAEAAVGLADAYASAGKWNQSADLLDFAIAKGHSRVPWVLSARSIAAGQLGNKDEALEYALAASEIHPMSPYTLLALIAALPSEEREAKRELAAKLQSLASN